MRWLEESNIFKSIWFSSAQSSFIPKFLPDFCDNIRRAHTVLARSKMQRTQNVLQKKFSVSLEKDSIFCFHIYKWQNHLAKNWKHNLFFPCHHLLPKSWHLLHLIKTLLLPQLNQLLRESFQKDFKRGSLDNFVKVIPLFGETSKRSHAKGKGFCLCFVPPGSQQSNFTRNHHPPLKCMNVVMKVSLLTTKMQKCI